MSLEKQSSPQSFEEEKKQILQQKKPETKIQEENFFNKLNQEIDKIADSGQKVMIKSLVEELKQDCQDYLDYEKEYLELKQNNKEKQGEIGILTGEDEIIEKKFSKKRLIEDSLESLNRIFNSYGLNGYLPKSFVNEPELKCWLERAL